MEESLPGDLLKAAVSRQALDLLPDRDRGNLDPQTVAEFLEYDIGFEVEPAVGFTFPAEVDRG